jgi:hypothetical protein
MIELKYRIPLVGAVFCAGSECLSNKNDLFRFRNKNEKYFQAGKKELRKEA